MTKVPSFMTDIKRSTKQKCDKKLMSSSLFSKTISYRILTGNHLKFIYSRNLNQMLGIRRLSVKELKSGI